MKKLVRQKPADDGGYKPQYTLTESIVALVAQIAEAAGKFSLDGEQALRLRRVNRIRTIHGSVAIEGNTLI